MKTKDKNGNPSTLDRLKVMIEVFFDENESQELVAKKLGIKRSTFYTWFKKKGQKKTIRESNLRQISDALGLDYSVWEDRFSSINDFCQKLTAYKKVTMCEDELLDSLIKVSGLDSEEAKLYEQLFEQAIEHEEEGKVVEALEKIEQILATPSAFLLSNANEVKFFYAKLLGSKSIHNTKKAIEVLNELCQNKYHNQEPEVLTLFHSNFKRKYLYCDDGVNFREAKDVNLEQIVNICEAYKEIFEQGSVKTQYYDALNHAYLYNILSYLKNKTLERKWTEKIYKDVKKSWRVDSSRWWEVISEAEFFMLLGDMTSAKSIVNNFLEEYTVKENERDATVRQLELYIHFTEDENAIEFYGYLKESFYYKSLKM